MFPARPRLWLDGGILGDPHGSQTACRCAKSEVPDEPPGQDVAAPTSATGTTRRRSVPICTGAGCAVIADALQQTDDARKFEVLVADGG